MQEEKYIFKFIYVFNYCLCVYACVPEYMSKHHMPAGALRGQKRTLNFLYLEFSSRVDAGSQIWILFRVVCALNC